jgi:hypothetical protein
MSIPSTDLIFRPPEAAGDARGLDSQLKARFIKGFRLKLTPMGSAVPLPQNNRPSEDVTIARLIFGKPHCRFLISGNG